MHREGRHNRTVAIYNNGDGPTIMVRTRLYALPMKRTPASTMRVATRLTEWAGWCSSPIASATTSTLRAGSEPRNTIGLQTSGATLCHRPAVRKILWPAPVPACAGLFTALSQARHRAALHERPIPSWQRFLSYRDWALSAADGLGCTFHAAASGSAPHTTVDPVAIARAFIVDPYKA